MPGHGVTLKQKPSCRSLDKRTNDSERRRVHFHSDARASVTGTAPGPGSCVITEEIRGRSIGPIHCALATSSPVRYGDPPTYRVLSEESHLEPKQTYSTVPPLAPLHAPRPTACGAASHSRSFPALPWAIALAHPERLRLEHRSRRARRQPCQDGHLSSDDRPLCAHKVLAITAVLRVPGYPRRPPLYALEAGA